ncbi:hypothetical protein KA017_02555 [Candidatus Woesebacteria bacterium]|nr:hypothetical protein [Candidatus Woesebacteria bacterium]
MAEINISPEVAETSEKLTGVEAKMTLEEASGVGKYASREDNWSPDD